MGEFIISSQKQELASFIHELQPYVEIVRTLLRTRDRYKKLVEKWDITVKSMFEPLVELEGAIHTKLKEIQQKLQLKKRSAIDENTKEGLRNQSAEWQKLIGKIHGKYCELLQK